MSGNFDKVSRSQELANKHEQLAKDAEKAVARANNLGFTNHAVEIQKSVDSNNALAQKYSESARIELTREGLEGGW
jgi:Tfp pilus assembly protein FimT